MALPTKVIDQGRQIQRHGMVIQGFVGDVRFPVEVQRAPDSGGSPDVGNAVSLGVLPPGSTVFVDESLGSSDDTFHYRMRHQKERYNGGTWLSWHALQTAPIPEQLPVGPPEPLLSCDLLVNRTALTASLFFNGAPRVRSIRYALDAASFPASDTGGTVVNTDGNGDRDVDPTAHTLASAEAAVFLTVTCYDGLAGAGAILGTLRRSVSAQVTGAVSVRLELDVDLTTDPSRVSLTARSYLGDTLSGVVEFLDPERTFISAGAITATDKTLTIAGGGLTDEDVGKYISVAGAGAGGILLESRVEAVTSGVECELEDAAGTTVSTATTILGGGFHQDFDYSGSAGHTETNFRIRPVVARDTTYITVRAVAGGQISNPQTILLTSQQDAKLLSFYLEVVDDYYEVPDPPTSLEDQYTFHWTLSDGVTDDYSVYCEGGKEDDRGTPLVTGTENSPVTNSSRQINDEGAADGLEDPHHWGRAILKDPDGNPIGQLEDYDVTPTVP